MSTTAPQPCDTPAAPQPSAPAPDGAAHQHEFLAFRLGQEEYGLPILRVQEIRSYEKPTALPNAPADLLGVANLRGVIVPYLDLRRRLGMPQAQFDTHTVVIVVHVAARVIGLVVDGVSDVITLQPGQIRPVPALVNGLEPQHLIGLGTVGERMLILLDIAQYLTDTLRSASAVSLH